MTCSVDCASPPDGIEAYGDIAGLGVFLSFLLSAGTTVVVVIAYYIFAFDDALDPYRKPNTRTQVKHPNIIDRHALHMIRTPFSWHACLPMAPTDWERFIIRLARTISDIQIFTGIAILISGFLTRSCDLQSYHWQLIIYLSWLGLVTHAAILSALRNHLYNDKPQLFWRFSAMLVILVMFNVAVWSTNEFSEVSSDSFALPRGYAKCKPPPDRLDLPTGWAAKYGVFTLSNLLDAKLKLSIFVIYGFIIRVWKLSPAVDRIRGRLAYRLREKAIHIEYDESEATRWNPHKNYEFGQRLRTLLLEPLQIAFCRVLHLHLDILTSFLAEVVWAILSFSWAAKRLIALRSSFSPAEDDRWTFGQVVPIVLLFAPLVHVFEINWRKVFSGLRNRHLRVVPKASDPPLPVSEGYKRGFRPYEVSKAFHLGGTFVGLSYIHLAIITIVADEVNLSVFSAYIAFSLFLVFPALQLTWVLYALWIPALDSIKARHRASLSHFTFLTLALFMSSRARTLMDGLYTFSRGGVPTELPATSEWKVDLVLETPILGSICMGMLAATYAIFVLWFAVDSWLRLHHYTKLRGLFALVPGAILAALSLTFLLVLDTWSTISRPYWSFAGGLLAAQAVLQLLELGLEKVNKGRWEDFIRSFFFCAVLLPSLILPYTIEVPDIPSLFIMIPIVLIVSSVWPGFWYCYEGAAVYLR